MLPITSSLDSNSSIVHLMPLINLTGNIRKALDNGNIDCGVFVDLQKASDTVSKVELI